MARTRASAKAAGARFERQIADHLAKHVDDRIDRRVRNGAKDRGDLGGLRSALGDPICAELKDYGGQIKAAEWMNEARVEAGNADAPIAIVIAKRRGTTAPGEQWVITTVDDLARLIVGQEATE